MLTLEFLFVISPAWQPYLILVIGVASTLAASNQMCGLAALATGPRSRWRLTIPITDPSVLTCYCYTITWLPDVAARIPLQARMGPAGSAGSLAYLVMGLSFISVGITEFASRRGDKVMSDTIRSPAYR